MVAETQEFDAQAWVKTRSSLDPTKSTFLVWKGAIYAFTPGEKKKLLFEILGVSVSRCTPTKDDSWNFTSRELTYYLDPKTSEIVQKWENPWTGEKVPVMHVANSPVQGQFKGKFPAQVDGDTTTFVFDIFPTYPNPLADDPKFAEYCPNPTYQAAELFKGELNAIYILEKYQRQGIGHNLVSTITARLVQLNVNSMLVWVLADNSACKFYESLGGQVIKQKLNDRSGVQLLEVAYGWTNMRSLLINS